MSPCSTFCLVDAEGSCLAVNVYNVAEGKGVIIGDTVVIPEPPLAEVDVRHKHLVSGDAVV